MEDQCNMKGKNDSSESAPNLNGESEEEGLLRQYDVVLCGTGLVQAILASALTRAGKTVLHCDGNDHYGELDAVWTYDYLNELFHREPSLCVQADDARPDDIPLAPEGSNQSLRFHSMQVKTEFPITPVGSKVRTLYGEGVVIARTLPTMEKNGSLAIELSKWTMADGKSPIVYFGVPNAEIAMEDYFQSSPHLHVQSLAALAAQKILHQQSRSLAFDVTPSLLYASGPAVQGLLTSNVASHLEFQTMQGMYWLSDTAKQLQRVPCSKGDVMLSTLLPALDKRRFMKFLQITLDYATEREQEVVLSLNERQLNQGRSLARPQNKALSKKDLHVLYDCMEQNLPFDTYLQDHAKLSNSHQLRQLIRHALALDTDNCPTGLSTREGMGRLCDHLKALGRFGTTAFLTPLYGSGELSQFFCRSAAVYGATYLLRRSPQTIITDNAKVQGVAIGPSDHAFGPPVPAKHILASHVVVAQDAIRSTVPSRRRLLRRVGVLRGTLIPDASRSVVILPPGSAHPYAIHGVVLDETSKVAPAGCSLLHLTTVVDRDGVENNPVLDLAAQNILDSARQQDTGPEEIFHATFSYGLVDPADGTCAVEGLHLIHRTVMPMVVDDAFERASAIFKDICRPEEEFLALSDRMEAKLKEQLQGAYRGPNPSDDDTEQLVLDSAMRMLESTVVKT